MAAGAVDVMRFGGLGFCMVLRGRMIYVVKGRLHEL